MSRNLRPINRDELVKFYINGKRSVASIAKQFGCSTNKVQFWMERYEIPRRTISDAIYAQHNPNGDPFCFAPPKTVEEAILFGLGLGLYWGEGTKANRNSVRLGNTDPKLIDKFLRFLVKFFSIDRNDCSFGLQVFSDMDPRKAQNYWQKQLKVKKSQFYKTIVTRTGAIGTYRRKSEYGVLTVYYNNSHLRTLIGSLLPE